MAYRPWCDRYHCEIAIIARSLSWNAVIQALSWQIKKTRDLRDEILTHLARIICCHEELLSTKSHASDRNPACSSQPRSTRDFREGRYDENYF